MLKSQRKVLRCDENVIKLESIIKTEAERFEDEYFDLKTDENQRRQELWPKVVVTDVLLPTVTLKRLTAKEIKKLTSDHSRPKKAAKKQRRSLKIKREPKYNCQECDEIFMFRYELSRHILKVHYEGEKFECECGKLHRHRSSFYACRSSHRTSGFTCKICEREFAARTSILGHWKRMHLEEHGKLEIDNLVCLKNDGNFICDVCGKILKGRKALVRHLTYQHFNPDLSCDLCPQKYKRIGDLRIHMNRHHLNVKPYRCDICGYRTAFQTNLRSHRKRHFGIKESKRASCKICKKKMQTTSLTAHMKNFHESTCHKCLKSFDSKQELMRHLIDIHFDGKSRNCKKCNTLNIHNKTCYVCIQDPKKFFCDLCSNKSVTYSSLRTHYEIAHPGVTMEVCRTRVVNQTGPFTCDRCDEKVMERKELEGHFRTHKKNLKIL